MLMAKPQQIRLYSQIHQINQARMIVNQQQRLFAKKKKKDSAAQTEDEEHTEPEPVPEPVVETPPAPKADFSGATKAQEAEKVDSSLFSAFTLGDVKKIDSTPDHKPPSLEDTIEGRYASVLFSTASQSEALYTIYEDMAYIKALYTNSESFRLFTQNAGVGNREIQKFNQALSSVGDFHPLTIKFLEILAENKRLVFVKEIAEKYAKLYQ